MSLDIEVDQLDGHAPAAELVCMLQFDRSRLAGVCRRHDVTQLRMFAPPWGGEDPDSRIRLVAQFASAIGFFEVFRLEDELEQLFGRQVDVVTEPGLSPYLREPILNASSVIFDGAGGRASEPDLA